MGRDVNKWSKDSTYEDYRASRDYETWVYIKVPPQMSSDYDENAKYYAPIILPMVKKLCSALEPAYNATLLFYTDKYERDVIIGSEGVSKEVHEVLENPVPVWLDLSKFKNYLDWTEKDIEEEVNITDGDLFITLWKKANGVE